MGQFTNQTDLIDDALEVAEVLEALSALLTNGLQSLAPTLIRAFERDDYAGALRHARDHYSSAGAQDRDAALMYAVLLSGRELCEEAAGVLRRALEHHQHDVALQLGQVLNLIASGEVLSGIELMNGLRAVDPRDGRYWALMGDVYLEQGLDGDTIACYERALELRLQDADVAYRLSRLLLEADKSFEGARYMERAARIAVQDERLWALSAQAWRQAGEIERSADAWGRVVKIDEDDLEGWMNYGVAQRDCERYGAAQKAFERAMDLDPFCVDARVELAHLQFETGYTEEALQNYRKALAEEPGRLDALHGVAAAAFEQGDMTLALDFAQRALEAAPESAESNFNYGVILLQLNRASEAVASLKAALEIDDRDDYRVVLATALLKSGERERSVEMFEGLDSDELSMESVLEFIQAVLAAGGYEVARGLLIEYAIREDEWALVHPAIDYLIGCLAENARELLDDCIERFDSAHELHESLLPLGLDMEGFERLAMRLPRNQRRVVERMLWELSS